jgi:hypothetical protein
MAWSISGLLYYPIHRILVLLVRLLVLVSLAVVSLNETMKSLFNLILVSFRRPKGDLFETKRRPNVIAASDYYVRSSCVFY